MDQLTVGSSTVLPKGVFPRLEMSEGVLPHIQAKRREKTWVRQLLEFKDYGGYRAAVIDHELLSGKPKEELLEKFGKVPVRKTRAELTKADIVVRWPALTSHLICESLGYATPDVAAQIILDAVTGQQNWCEWLFSCYKCDPMKALKDSIRNRHHHTGYMAEFKRALAITILATFTGRGPMFASWF